ncbi:DUF6250 domain-containing protein [Echinicola jeungdonensis]|uniref:DUF6250 domain-containing protein n=1 Tax=Echinicola jeungdonensis TaxID=709343 RepID=A0ABV5J7F1_9BACT|nr:DUF6250 domain-containing protein [Echinicola jeungdonensis]MDN3669529.1 DUF6250 domain-containing protein [Echinicola jeungdonensis]
MDFNRHFIYGLFLAGIFSACSQEGTEQKDRNEGSTPEKVIFQSDFSGELDPQTWKTEIEDPDSSKVVVIDGKLVLDSNAGVTVWLDKKLKGDIEITYQREVIMEEGVNDRLSDLNQFWMATDPRNENLFTRSGSFKEYDSLSMYYVGFGGNYNSTTRFRKYHGDGEKPLLFDLRDKAHLLQPNHVYDIKIKVDDGLVSYWVDDNLFFQYQDENPLEEGYFGFRSTWSRHAIDNLKIVQLEK